MSFTPFVAQPKGPAGSGFSAALVKMRSAPAALRFFLRISVATQLGWGDGDKLEVAIGDEEHHGLVRLRKAPTGTAEVRIRKTVGPASFAQIIIGHVPQFIDRTEKKRWCQFDLVEDGADSSDTDAAWVEVVLPSWADETSGTKRQRVIAPPARPLAIAPPARSVVSVLAGDPPAGRSALANRGREPTRGQARREAELREVPQHVVAEAAAWNRRAADDAKLAGLCEAFGLTLTEARVVVVLLDGAVHRREAIHDAAYGAEPGGGPELKIIDVFITKIRKKLTTRLVEIKTIRALGYQMEAESVARVMVLLDDSGPSRDADEAELAALPDDDEEAA